MQIGIKAHLGRRRSLARHLARRRSRDGCPTGVPTGRHHHSLEAAAGADPTSESAMGMAHLSEAAAGADPS